MLLHNLCVLVVVLKKKKRISLKCVIFYMFQACSIDIKTAFCPQFSGLHLYSCCLFILVVIVYV